MANLALNYLTTFGGQTLHNGTSHRAKRCLPNSGKAKLDFVQLPNGVVFDPNGVTGTAAVMPTTVISEHVISMSSGLTTQSELQAIMGLIGTRANLTATLLEGGSVACLARLEKVVNLSVKRSNARQVKVKLTFQPINNWG